MARKSRKNLPVKEAPSITGMRIWKAGLYIRLSVEFRGNHGDSLETQRQIMEAYLALCPDIEIVETYTDNGVSGQIFDRKEFQRLLADTEAGKIDCIVVKDLSRLGRNAIDTGYYIEKYFPLHGIRFIAVNDQYDSESAENGGNHIIVPLKNIVNEAYAVDIAKKVRSQAHQAMCDGDYLGARPPYGYKKDPDNCHKLLINEDTAPVVREIFEWAASGVPLAVIVKRLNVAGYPTPGHYLASVGIISNKRLMGSGKWQTWSVGKMLADEVYVGDMVQGKTVSINKRQIPTPPDQWIVVRNTHEPIISRELFAKVQTMREKAAADHDNTTKEAYSENILRGRIFCGCCGRTLHRERSRSTGYTYHCIANDRIGQKVCENAIGYLREPALFSAIVAIVKCEAEVLLGNALKVKQQSARIVEQKEKTTQEIITLRRDAEKAKTYLAGLYENFITGVLTQAEYREMKAGYERKVAEYTEKVSQLQDRQRELENQAANCVTLAKRLAEIETSEDLTAAFVKQVIQKVIVTSKTDVTIVFSYSAGFDRLKEVFGDV